MSLTVDYYLAPHSPWTYLGHDRFIQIARQAGATVRLKPVDLGQIFPVSGGLPLPQRAPQRQAYRLVELRRFSDHLQRPLNLQPRHFPVPIEAAARLLLAVDAHDGTEAALSLAGAILAAVWVQERNVSDEAVLGALLSECRLPAQRLAESREPVTSERYQAYTREAIDAGVFGAPSFVVDGEIFWGQDRLDFLARRLGLPA